MSRSGQEFREGWLWKWTNYVTGYQKRWFVLSGGVLSYYTRPEETEFGCRGNAILSSARWIRENQYNFRIEVDGSFTYYLKAEEADGCDRWLSAFDSAKSNGTQCSILQGLSTSDMLEGILRPVEAKLQEIQTSCEANTIRGTAMLGALEKLEKEIESYDMPKCNVTKELKESMTLFRVTSSAMLTSCSEFTQLLSMHVRNWRSASQSRNMASRADADTADEDEMFQDATELPFQFQHSQEFEVSQPSTAAGISRRSNFTVLGKSDHRKVVPHKPNYKLNLWSILKYCIGRDISKLPVPVNFGEPISILQKLAEDLEYSELLDQAALCTDSCMQLAYVAAFSVSGYSSTAIRTGKPFNPMLGETYELDSMNELGFRFIAEQVTHHPPKAALYAESSKNNGHGGWSYWQDITPSSKFRGNYLTLTPIGTLHLLFHESGNHYTWNKVTITVNNIILGKLWFDQSGISKIINHKSGDKCDLKYHQYSFSHPSAFRKVSGTVMDGNGLERYQITGRWDKEVKYKDKTASSKKRNDEYVLWSANPLPEHADRMYNFSRMAMILNEWDDSCAPTDSRRRPDQRQMENGQWDEANQSKLELEEKQRERRRKLETENAERKKNNMQPKQHKPRWFTKRKCSLTGQSTYLYDHQYWEAKEKQEWTDCPDIFTTFGGNFVSSETDWPSQVRSSRIRD